MRPRSFFRAALCIIVVPLFALVTGCAEETDGPTPALAPSLEPPATCNFSNDENAAGQEVVVLRSPDGTFSPMAENGLDDPPGLALPRVLLVHDGAEIEVRRVEFVSTSELHVIIDASLALPAGEYQFKVVNPNGRASDVSATFEVFDPPSIDGVTPDAVCAPHQTITITGTGFRDGTTVTVGGEPLVDATIVDQGTITGSLPEDLPPGRYDIVITSPEGCTATLAGAITVGDTPFTVEAIVPARGWNGIDNPITVYGSGFVDGMGVALVGAAPGGGDWPLTFVSVDAGGTFIEGVVPEGGEPGGPYPVLVTAPDGCAVELAPGFTIDGEPSITLSDVIPPFGWTEAKTRVTIVGSGFISTPRGYLVIPDAADINPLRKLKSTAFVTGTTLNATVPPGLPPGGPYDLVVINPDGGGGKLSMAFTVTSLPTPEIRDVSPGAGTTQDDTDVLITGCNFREPLTVELRDPAGVLTAATNLGTPLCTGAATCPGGASGATNDRTNECTLDATFPSMTLDAGAYVVRVTDDDEGAWGEWSAFVITNPAVKLNVWAAGSAMRSGRRGHAAASGRIDNPGRFIYAVGGNGGDPAVPFDTVEVVPLDIFGGMGTWFEQRERLTTARSDLTLFQQGGYLYAIGGRSDATTALDSVERAKILLDDGAPELTDPPALADGTLAAGSWYYQVAALLPLTDPDNPGGETLPSDEVVVSLGIGGGVLIEWTEVADATAYRIYRTEAENGASHDEVFLAEVAARATSFTDDGSVAPDVDRRPQRRGATGVWVTVTGSELAVARFDHESVVAHDPNGDAFIYVLGGSGSCSDCYEYASISDDGATLGSWAAGAGTFLEPRTELAAAVAESSNAPQVPAGEAWIYVTGGTGVSQSLEAAQVMVGGDLGPFAVMGPPDGAEPGARELAEAIVISDSFYLMGGRTSNQPLNGARISVEFEAQTPPQRSSFSSSSNQMVVPREDFALVLESAFFYAIGGSSDGANAVASTDTVIY